MPRLPQLDDEVSEAFATEAIPQDAVTGAFRIRPLIAEAKEKLGENSEFIQSIEAWFNAKNWLTRAQYDGLRNCANIKRV